MPVIGANDVAMLVLYHSAADSFWWQDGYTVYYTFYDAWNLVSDRHRLLLNLRHPHLNQAYQTAIEFQQQQQRIARLQRSKDSITKRSPLKWQLM